MNVCLETFGCRLNRAEALECEAKLLALGHKIVPSHSKADMIIVRGCSVTSRAQRDCERLIAHLKRKYPNTRLVITGCLAKAEKKIPIPGDKSLEPDAPEPLPTSTARAYLKVQDGCSGKCSFCIVPQFRGASRSEPFEKLTDKAKRLIDSGYHEIVVTGCNLSLYASEGKRLPELLSSLASLSPECRIRLGSIEPGPCALEVVSVMAENRNICNFLHLPFQSGSDRILKSMARPYTAKDVSDLVARSRDLMPAIGLGCDAMVGFPGETEGDFLKTHDMLTRLAFSNAHVFQYSERPGTPAASLRSSVQHAIRSQRARMLSSIAKTGKERFARQFIGKQVDVVIESHTSLKGWTGEYLWLEGPVNARIKTGLPQRKSMASFVVKSAHDGILRGVLA